jgi:alpha-L-rhamnosidase
VVALLAVTGDGKRVDLRSRNSVFGDTKWSADVTGAKVYVVTTDPGGPEVKRSAPGGGGLMLNPFDPAAMNHYLERFSTAFDAYRGPRPRAMYHDSYEYNSSWAPDLLDAFARLRGYRLEDEWPAFCGNPQKDEAAARVRADFKETLSDLMVERVFPEWIHWCRARSLLTRYQAHGSPANLLDLYALADMPETEMFGRGTRNPLRSGFDERFGEGDRDPLVSKFASSAAHLVGRPRVASETGTWMAEHFCETLEEMKCLADLLFVSGINHVFYHGTCYSPDDAAWPGWLFYASTEMNPRNAIWHDAAALNNYITRCQSVLQSGQPDNDVLLYWPIHEYWHSESALVTGLSVHNHSWLRDQPVGDCARRLWQRGYGFDYVSDRLLAGARTAGRDVVLPGGSYRVIVVPRLRFIPLPTLKKLLSVAKDGATVIFQDQLPRDVPGQADLAGRRAVLQKLLRPLSALETDQGEERVGKGQVLVADLEQALGRAKVPREAISDHNGAQFIRRLQSDGRDYFIVNQGSEKMNGWYALGLPAKSVVALDPLSGRTGGAAHPAWHARRRGGPTAAGARPFHFAPHLFPALRQGTQMGMAIIRFSCLRTALAVERGVPVRRPFNPKAVPDPRT